MWRKIKPTVFFILYVLGALIYLRFIILILICFWSIMPAVCKRCNICLILSESNSRSYHYTGASHWRKNIVEVITQDRVVDDNLKRKIKNRTLYTGRLFLLKWIFQYINNWSKIFEHLRTLFFWYIHGVIIFPHFSRKTIFQLKN